MQIEVDNFVKNDSGKLQWSILPFEQLEDVVKVLMHGAETYTRDNWQKCDDPNRYVDALMRHVIAYKNGEKLDTGTGGDGLPHLAHAVCNCLFLMWFDSNKKSCKTCKNYNASRVCEYSSVCRNENNDFNQWEKQE